MLVKENDLKSVKMLSRLQVWNKKEANYPVFYLKSTKRVEQYLYLTNVYGMGN